MKITLENICYESFKLKDAKALYKIRNHHSVRKYLLKKKPITYPSHLKWLKKNIIKNTNNHILMIKKNNQALGFLVVCNIKNNFAEIGLMIKNPEKHLFLAAISSVILAYCALDIFKIRNLYAYVNPLNYKAIKLDTSLGMEKIKSEKNRTQEYKYKLTKALRNKSSIHLKILNRIKPYLIIKDK